MPPATICTSSRPKTGFAAQAHIRTSAWPTYRLATNGRRRRNELDSLTSVQIGQRELPRDQALEIVHGYAVSYHGRVRWYDLAGDESDQPSRASAIHPANAVTLADIGRLVIINADLRADAVPALLTAASETAFAEVAPDARLEDCAPGSPLYLTATALYDHFRQPGIGPLSAQRCCTSSAPGSFRSTTPRTPRVRRPARGPRPRD